MPESPLTLNRCARFYAPLAATSLLLTVTNPLLISAMSRSVHAAAWFLAAPVGQYQHVSIGLVDCKQSHRAVQRSSLVLATGVALLVAVAANPGSAAIRRWWRHRRIFRQGLRCSWTGRTATRRTSSQPPTMAVCRYERDPRGSSIDPIRWSTLNTTRCVLDSPRSVRPWGTEKALGCSSVI